MSLLRDFLISISLCAAVLAFSACASVQKPAAQRAKDADDLASQYDAMQTDRANSDTLSSSATSANPPIDEDDSKQLDSPQSEAQELTEESQQDAVADNSDETDDETGDDTSDPDTAPQVVGRELDIPLGEHEYVDNWLQYFSGPGAARFRRWIERYGRYAPLMRPILRDTGLPEDTIYLSMIESGFVPRALSKAKASGPWQFMAATGAAYGLKQDFWVDERRDPVKATHAAARHLKDLYQEFGDWHLAWAAYNAGSGKIRTAISRYGTRSFFELVKHPYLKPETKNYVPKLIAAAKVAADPLRYGIGEVQPLPQFAWDEILLPDATDVGLIAEICHVDIDELSELNPELRRFATPPVPTNAEPYRFRVPPSTGPTCQQAFNAIPPKKRLTFRHHRVRSGEVPGKIARRYGISLKVLLDMNKVRDPRRLRVGQDLIIPIPSKIPERLLRRDRVAQHAGDSGERRDNKYASSQQQQATTSAATVDKATEKKAPAKRKTAAKKKVLPAIPANATAIKHVVASGDNLWLIAQRYKVTVANLKRWNGFRRTPVLQPGQEVIVYQVSNP